MQIITDALVVKNFMSEKICSICSRKIELDDHPLGLVFGDEIFVCEECADKHAEEDLLSKAKTIMENPYEKTGMPIAVWLIHEQNKDKTMMTVKK